jgi:hypothetical protein
MFHCCSLPLSLLFSIDAVHVLLFAAWFCTCSLVLQSMLAHIYVQTRSFRGRACCVSDISRKCQLSSNMLRYSFSRQENQHFLRLHPDRSSSLRALHYPTHVPCLHHLHPALVDAPPCEPINSPNLLPCLLQGWIERCLNDQVRVWCACEIEGCEILSLGVRPVLLGC